MSLIKHKKVELTELFYDLVYVYTISQITSLIHHVHHGVVGLESFFIFAVGLIIFVNSWMVQTVYTNRFGQNSLTNIAFMFLQMMCLLVSSTAITQDWEKHFTAIFLPMALISLILLFQYVVEYFKTDNPADKKFIQRFFYILGLRSLALLVSVFLPYQLALIVAVGGVLLTWILPGLLTNPVQNQDLFSQLHPINFPHLIERLSLLVIITFGETIIGIADYFSVENLSLSSLLIFIAVTNLFMIYIVEIDHMIDEHQTGITGNGAIYYHYLIFFGLSFITVSLNFIGNEEASPIFAISLLYAGILALMSGLFLHNGYNKTSHRFTTSLKLWEFGSLAVGYALSFLFLENRLALTVLVFLVTTVMTTVFVRFNLKNTVEE